MAPLMAMYGRNAGLGSDQSVSEAMKIMRPNLRSAQRCRLFACFVILMAFDHPVGTWTVAALFAVLIPALRVARAGS